MIIWLDNQDHHKGAIDENYRRELPELFSVGVGNCSEQDIKECARAFTGSPDGPRLPPEPAQAPSEAVAYCMLGSTPFLKGA